MTPQVKAANELAATKPPIEKLLPFVQHEIDQRKHTWTLTTMEWSDVSQLLMIRVWKKYHLFDPTKGPFQNWLNTTITNKMTNILRDNLFRYSRPCIRDGGCSFNMGNGHCEYTPSGLQCEECPMYAVWKMKKEGEFNIKASVALEHHAQEVNNIQSDFLDIERTKQLIDEKMMKELDRWERIVYKLLYIENLTPAQASERLKVLAQKPRKNPLKETDAVDYQLVLREAKRFKQMMIEIIKREDLM